MPGSTYHPLETTSVSGERTEAERFRESAKAGDITDEYIGLVGIDTGVRVSTLAHSQRDWFKLKAANPRMIVPIEEDCELGTGDGRGGDNSRRNRDQPCHQCKNRNIKDWAPDDADWHPKSRAGANRSIPIKSDDTKRAIRDFFRAWDKVLTPNRCTERIKDIGERADLDRGVTAHDLRDTYGTKLANDGFGVHKIKHLMGHSGIQQAIDYIQLSGQDLDMAYEDKWSDY